MSRTRKLRFSASASAPTAYRKFCNPTAACNGQICSRCRFVCLSVCLTGAVASFSAALEMGCASFQLVASLADIVAPPTTAVLTQREAAFVR